MGLRETLRTKLDRVLEGDEKPVAHGSWRGGGVFGLVNAQRTLSGRKHEDLILVSKQLAGLVRANVDLVECMDGLSRGGGRRRLRALYGALASDLSADGSLSGAMRLRPGFFPAYYCDLVQAGEEAGQLEPALLGLCDYLESAKTTFQRVAGLLAYISVMLAIQCTIGAFILAKVVPVAAEIFTEFGMPGAPIMSWLVNVGDFIAEYWLFFLSDAAVVLLLLLAIPWLIHSRGLFTDIVSGAMAHVPLLRGLAIKGDLSHIALLLERYLDACVPLDEALERVAEADLTPMYRRLLRRLARRVEAGDSLREAMDAERRRHLLPEAFRGTVSVGESAGLLPAAFGRIGRLYRRDLMKTQRVLAEVMTPVGLAIPACITFLFATSWFQMYGKMVEIFLSEM
ncbi:MAG: type pilus assembly protein PilC [Candidatus Hydrogenedentes bacterium]|nr:type pilus assembly protein PilC [Candidatus Hydrogenedentota bacterium]